jgi:hypothetical protein
MRVFAPTAYSERSVFMARVTSASAQCHSKRRSSLPGLSVLGRSSAERLDRGEVGIEKDELLIAATFEALLVIALAGEEALQDHEQEGAELSLLAIRAGVRLGFNQVGEETPA